MTVATAEMKDGAGRMRMFRARVTLGDGWCVHLEDVLEVLRVDRLLQVEPAARAWLAQRHGIDPEAVLLDLVFDR
jgi:hypothetical protein